MLSRRSISTEDRRSRQLTSEFTIGEWWLRPTKLDELGLLAELIPGEAAPLGQ